MEPLKEQKLIDEGSSLQKILGGFKDRLGEGREDYRQAIYASREAKNLDPEDARLRMTLATNPTFVMGRDLMNISEPGYRKERETRGMGLSQDPMIRGGQVVGTLANDVVNDSSRGLWWLLNAPQAVANVVNEVGYASANPDLFQHDQLDIKVPQMETDQQGNVVPKRFKDQKRTRANREAYEAAIAEDLISKEGTKRKGVGMKNGNFTRRKYDPGKVAALGIPSGIAINAGIGLLNPFGGNEGYEAVLASDDDPTKTTNVIGEIGAKYILGKTGGLLPYEEFKKVRPDVSKDEYRRYQAFKYDKNADLNIMDDGQITLPFGVAKYTNDGIHGAEVQFLGRSLPVNTTLIPAATAILGTMAGVSRSRGAARGERTAIRDGIIGGMGGLTAGTTAGLIMEEARRRAGDVSTDQLG